MGMGIPDMLLCTELDCGKKAADSTGKCAIHGGVRRCDEIGCGKGAVGTSNKCVAHGGGRRCLENGCNKSSVSSSGKCVAHGGGRRCQEEVIYSFWLLNCATVLMVALLPGLNQGSILLL